MRCYAVHLKPRLVNAFNLFLFYQSKWQIAAVCFVNTRLELSTGVSEYKLNLFRASAIWSLLSKVSGEHGLAEKISF